MVEFRRDLHEKRAKGGTWGDPHSGEGGQEEPAREKCPVKCQTRRHIRGTKEEKGRI